MGRPFIHFIPASFMRRSISSTNASRYRVFTSDRATGPIVLLAIITAAGCDSAAPKPREPLAAQSSDSAVVELATESSWSAATKPVNADAENFVSSVEKSGTHDDESGFSIMTWNLEWFWDDEVRDNYSKLSVEQSAPDRAAWNWRRDAVAAAVAEASPTVLAVQEIESQRIAWYLTKALDRNHQLAYDEVLIQGGDHFTEQDVALFVRRPAEVIASMVGNVTTAMKKSGRYGSVSKHLITTLEVPVGDAVETVFVVNLHLKAGADSDATRAKQIETVNAWIDRFVPRGDDDSPVHLIVLGDFNTEQLSGSIGPASELGLLIARGTSTTDDDLIDLHANIPAGERRTHLLENKQFDRILVSRSLVDDSPDQLDLTLVDVRVMPELAIQADRDEQDDHWNRYWELPDDQRDLSDHYPVMARFEVR